VKREATGFDASYNMKEYNGVVLVASGLTAGQTYNLTVKNVADAKGNAIPAAGLSVSVKAEGDKTWSVVGANESGFVNDVIRSADGSFEVVSGGVAFWADYDEATFVNQKVKGDFDAKVQLVEQDPSSQWARTGLMAREALDEGKARVDHGACDTGPIVDGAYCVPKAQLFSRLQTVHANSHAVWNNSVASNWSYENHWRAEDTYAVAWANQMNSADGGFGPLDYPNVWMRLKREGSFLNTYRSTDGENWNTMTSRYFPKLAEELYIGPFFGPELANNAGWTAADPAAGIGHSVLARFRNYSITAGTPPVGNEPTISIARDATTIRITYTGTLLGADSVTGPYAAVQGATSPYTVTPAGSATFFKAGQ
jgi:regulation of enolase protein 1 (concanavalin A-like superfamily)